MNKPIQLNYAQQQSAHEATGRAGNLVTILAVTASISGFMLIIGLGLNQMFSAVVLGLVLAGLALLRPEAGIVATLIYLAVVGDIRRYLVSSVGVVSNDPMLLVAPSVVCLLVAIALTRRRMMLRTPESKIILVLCGVMALEMINPLQGGIMVGAAGALFSLVPLMWFWIGQSWGTPKLVEKLLFRAVVPLAVLASVLGLCQGLTSSYLGFEARWFRLTTESIARPDMRPFAFFCSWAEYPFYVGAALVIALTPLFYRKIRLSILFVPLFIAAMIVQSVREAIYESLLALVVLWAAQARSRPAFGARLVIASAVAAGTLIAGMTVLKSADIDVNTEAQKAIEHTTDGVLDIEHSSAGTHFELIGNGIVFGVTHPFGIGLGGTTSASKFGDAESFSSEIDFGDIFISCGAAAGVLYCILIFRLIRSAMLRWREHREPAALLALGLMTCQLGHWGEGSLYAVSALTWFVIGSTDRLAALSLPTAQLQARRVLPRPKRRLGMAPS